MKRICLALALLLAVEAPIIAQTSATKKKTTRKATRTTSRTTRVRTTDTTRMGEQTVKGSRMEDGYQHPSPYLGDKSPTNDGQEKNLNRNVNYNNTSQPLPANDGSK